MAKHGKKYTELLKKAPVNPVSLEEGVKLLPNLSATKFDASCELHARLGIDPKYAEQNIRTSVPLPHGTGKSVRVIAFCEDNMTAAAKKAGAVEAGLENLITKIKEGWLDFDVAIAQPATMRALGPVAKTLGQKGLMPNPKSGTVGDEVVKMIEEIKKGKVELRNDKSGNVHAVFGKVSFGGEKLAENAQAIVKALQEAKPAAVKGTYIESLTLVTTMGPAVKIDLKSL